MDKPIPYDEYPYCIACQHYDPDHYTEFYRTPCMPENGVCFNGDSFEHASIAIITQRYIKEFQPNGTH